MVNEKLYACALDWKKTCPHRNFKSSAASVIELKDEEIIFSYLV